MERKALEQLIEQIVRKVLAEQQPVAVKKEPQQWVSTRQLCEMLAITRQTLHNWHRQSATKNLITPYRKKQGNKCWYDIEGVIELIGQNPVFFGRDRDYHYKQAIQQVATAKKEDNRFYNLHWQVKGGKELTLQQKQYYREECEKRGVDCALNKRGEL